MKIETKFDVGQVVYALEIKEIKTKDCCPGCSGTGEIILDNKEKAKCPKCFGTKVLDSSKKYILKAKKTKIRRISIAINEEKYSYDGIRYLTSLGNSSFREAELADSLDSAKKLIEIIGENTSFEEMIKKLNNVQS